MIVIDKMFTHDVSIYLVFLFAFTLNYFFAMYISLPVNIDDGATHDLISRPQWAGDVWRVDRPQTGFIAMVDNAIVGIRFTTNWQSPTTDSFDGFEWLCLLFFQVITRYTRYTRYARYACYMVTLTSRRGLILPVREVTIAWS